MTASIDPSKLAQAFNAALPPGSVSTEALARYEVDGLTPAIVVTPATQAEVAAALRVAGEAGAAVVPFGGGTQQSLGMPPLRYDIALDLRRIDALVEHEPADLTVTVEAGMRFSTLQRLLGERGQWLPLDPPLPDEATIGGILATNASGPARLSRGTARDLLIGITVATAEGELVRAGGRVVKNVAGYDLGKLHIGALGTLGVIVQTSFKVAPLPPYLAHLAVSGELSRLTYLANAIIEARLAVQGMVLTKAALDGAWRLAVRFAGGDAAVQRSLAEATGLAGGPPLEAGPISEADWLSIQSLPAAGEVLARAAIPAVSTAATAEAMAGAGASVVAMPGAGVTYGAWAGGCEPEVLARLRVQAVNLGGALVIEKAPATLKRAIDVWGETRGDFALMQRIKQQLDPNRVLNPGRFVGGI